MHRPITPMSDGEADPFHDPSEDAHSPMMSERQRPRSLIGESGPPDTNQRYDIVPQTGTSEYFSGQATALPAPAAPPFASTSYPHDEPEGPFSDIYSLTNNVGIAMTTASIPSRQTTPSLYSRQDSEYGYEDVDLDESHNEDVIAPLTLPARPPRSHLRTMSSGEYNRAEWRPPSPPTTVESSTPPTSPIMPTSHATFGPQATDSHHVQGSPISSLRRKTLLNVSRVT